MKELMAQYGDSMTRSQVKDVLAKFRHTLKDYTTYGGNLTDPTPTATLGEWLGELYTQKLITTVLKC